MKASKPKANGTFNLSDWSHIPQIMALRGCPQHQIYHAEGCVWTHTQMVIDALIRDPAYGQLNENDQWVVFLAALFHDIEKPNTISLDEAGLVHQKNHSKKGAHLWRYLAFYDPPKWLSELGLSLWQREQIAALIEFHQHPFYAFNKNPAWVCVLSTAMRLDLLVMLARADIIGRVCPDKSKVLHDIDCFALAATEYGCSNKPYAWPTGEHLHSFFEDLMQNLPTDPKHVYVKPKKGVLWLMRGLPASGKDTWVAKLGLPWVGYDKSRQTLGLKYGQSEGLVAQHVLDQLRGYLRNQQDCVVNATHLTRLKIDKMKALAYAYDYKVKVIELRVNLSELKKRNAKRDSSIRFEKIQDYAQSLESLYPWHIDELMTHAWNPLSKAWQAI